MHYSIIQPQRPANVINFQNRILEDFYGNFRPDIGKLPIENFDNNIKLPSVTALEKKLTNLKAKLNCTYIYILFFIDRSNIQKHYI
jgi:hypothetical protein